MATKKKKPEIVGAMGKPSKLNKSKSAPHPLTARELAELERKKKKK